MVLCFLSPPFFSEYFSQGRWWLLLPRFFMAMRANQRLAALSTSKQEPLLSLLPVRRDDCHPVWQALKMRVKWKWWAVTAKHLLLGSVEPEGTPSLLWKNADVAVTLTTVWPNHPTDTNCAFNLKGECTTFWDNISNLAPASSLVPVQSKKTSVIIPIRQTNSGLGALTNAERTPGWMTTEPSLTGLGERMSISQLAALPSWATY